MKKEDKEIFDKMFELFENACKSMVLWLTEKRTREGIRASDPSVADGYYVLTTWPEALVEPATKVNVVEEEEEEEEDGDENGEPAYSVAHAFPLCEYVPMEMHKKNTAEYVKDLSENDPVLFQMYQGDTVIHDILDHLKEHIENTTFKDVAPPFLAIFRLMSGPPPDDGSEYHMDKLLFYQMLAPNEVMDKVASKEPVVPTEKEKRLK